MTNKIIAVFLSVVLLISVLCACGKSNSAGNSNAANTENSIVQDGPETESTQESTNPIIAIPNVDELTYLQYNALSPEAQQMVINTFSSQEEFLKWYSGIKQDHDVLQSIIMDTGNSNSNNNNNDTGNSNSNDNDNTGYTDPEVTQPTDPSVTQPTSPNDGVVTFLDYQAMSGSEQARFIASFPSVDAFMAWHANAVQEYKDQMTEWGSSNTPTDPTIETEG